MKRHKYILTIDKPCGQDWISMTQADIGKYCSQCSKTVVDFTQLADSEIIQIVEQTSDKLCGRLTNQQLNRIIAVQKSTNNPRLYKILAGLLAISTAERSFATDKPHSQIEIITSTENFDIKSELIISQEKLLNDWLKNVVQGKVIDAHTKETLPFVSILIKNTKTGAITDIDGKFKLTIPDSIVTDKIYLVVTYIGYETAEIVVDKKDLPITKDFIIVPQKQVLMGEVVIVKKKKWWQRKKKSCP